MIDRETIHDETHRPCHLYDNGCLLCDLEEELDNLLRKPKNHPMFKMWGEREYLIELCKQNIKTWKNYQPPIGE